MIKDCELEFFALTLTCVFIVLKVMGKISISWLWVFSPMWILLVLVLTIVAVYFATAYVSGKGD